MQCDMQIYTANPDESKFDVTLLLEKKIERDESKNRITNRDVFDSRCRRWQKRKKKKKKKKAACLERKQSSVDSREL